MGGKDNSACECYGITQQYSSSFLRFTIFTVPRVNSLTRSISSLPIAPRLLDWFHSADNDSHTSHFAAMSCAPRRCLAAGVLQREQHERRLERLREIKEELAALRRRSAA